MVRSLREKDIGQPEWLVGRVVSRLKRHRLWNSLLIVLPPLLAFLYIAFFLHRSFRIAPEALLLAGASLLGLATFVVLGRSVSRPPSPAFAARLIDDRAEGGDRFLTLATVDPLACSPLLLARLREETAALLYRVRLRRDFPYRLGRSFFISCIVSLALILLFHLASVWPSFSGPSPAEELWLMSKELARVPSFSPLAESAAKLAAEIRKQALSKEEERQLIRQLLQKVQEQIKNERSQSTGDQQLLGRVAEQLEKLAQGAGKGQGVGTGGSQNKEGEGGGDQSREQSGAEKEQGRTKSEREELQGEKSLPKEARGNDPRAAGGGKGSMEAGKDQNEKGKEEQKQAKGEGGKGGRNEQPSEEPKQPERFFRAGEESEKGLKGGRFVTVELPEGTFEGGPGGGRSGNGGKFAPRTPVSNLPLRQPDLPEASPEKQPLPLEYRALIR